MDTVTTAKAWKESDQKRDAGLTTPEDVIRYDNISYGSDPKWHLLDVYRPRGVKGKLPVIVNVHGGGWFYGDKELYQYYTMSLSERGFAVINFSYRLAPEHKYPAPIEDIVSVLNFMITNHEKYGFDLNNVFLVGDSAGGQLCYQTCILLSNPKYANLFSFKVNGEFKLRACALNCGIYNFFVSWAFGAPKYFNFYIGDDWRKYYRTFKFSRYVTKNFPPAYIMGAASDGLTYFVKPLHHLLNRKHVENEAHIYGDKKDTTVGHVFHVNQKLAIGKLCNDNECDFFRKHLSK